MRRVVYSKEAVRTLRRMPSNTANLIIAKIDQYATDTTSLGNNVKRLQGRPELRLRVGDWRVIFQEDPVRVSILSIAARSAAY